VRKYKSIFFFIRIDVSDSTLIFDKIAMEITTAKRDLDMLLFVLFWFKESIST